MRIRAHGVARTWIALAWTVMVISRTCDAKDSAAQDGVGDSAAVVAADSVAAGAGASGKSSEAETSNNAGDSLPGDGTSALAQGDSVSGGAAADDGAQGAAGQNLRGIVGRLMPGPIRSVIRWFYSHFFHLVALVSSLGVIGATFAFYFSRRERKRFLTTTRLSIMDKEVQKTCRYIEKHHDDPSMTVESICRDLVTGEAFLQALFEKELGMNVESFIEQVRVNRARMLLTKQPELSAREVGFLTGFGDETAFRETFRRITETDFDEYRGSPAAAEAESDRYVSERA